MALEKLTIYPEPDPQTRKPIFDRGITNSPFIGAIAHRIRSRDLAAVYDLAGRRSVNIGQLSQDESISGTDGVVHC